MTESCEKKNCLTWPILMLSLALFLLLAFQMQSILKERTMLKQAYAGQQQALDNGQKVQVRLDALAVATLRLAEGGNKNARAIIARMKELGITVNPALQAAAPAADAPSASPTQPASPVPAVLEKN